MFGDSYRPIKFNFIFPENTIKVIGKNAFIKLDRSFLELEIHDYVITIDDKAFAYYNSMQLKKLF
ncbi:hypothetical protein [Brachyspira sp.]|uniref:hypothetical protein n=1 Tax=Brachyspira sp. TaxID=1977261 RepID=UPI0026399E3B|nr:hypothetical protein [Brachyspira sp.]